MNLTNSTYILSHNVTKITTFAITNTNIYEFYSFSKKMDTPYRLNYGNFVLLHRFNTPWYRQNNTRNTVYNKHHTATSDFCHAVSVFL